MRYPLLLADDPYDWIGYLMIATGVVAVLCFGVAFYFLSRPSDPESDKQPLHGVWRVLLALAISALFTLGLCFGMLG